MTKRNKRAVDGAKNILCSRTCYDCYAYSWCEKPRELWPCGAWESLEGYRARYERKIIITMNPDSSAEKIQFTGGTTTVEKKKKV